MILEKISPLGDSEVKNMNNYNDIQIIIMAGGVGTAVSGQCQHPITQSSSLM